MSFILSPYRYGVGSYPPPGPSVLADDANYASNTVLLQGNGSSGGTSVVDQMGNPWTLVGNVQTDGSGALVFDGSGDYCYATRVGAIGTGDFSVEMKFRATSLASDGELFCISNASHDTSSFDLVMEWKTTGAIRCSIQNGSGTANVDITSSSGVVSAGVDYNLSFDVSGTTARIRLNGAVIGTGTISGTRVQGQTQVRIGALSPSGGVARYLNGKVYWLRVTAGVCRNTGSGTVTPPTDPVANWYAPVFSSRFSAASTNDIQGVCTDGTNVWVSSTTTIYKYTMAGSLVTSRNVSGDPPTVTSRQINGLAIRGGVLYVSMAAINTVGDSYIAEYDPSTLTQTTYHNIPGNWFCEGLAYNRGYWWLCFHATKSIAQVDPTTFGIVATHSVTFPITGTSGGYGGTQGYDGLAWVGDYLLCNIHEVYNEEFCDVYYWNGTTFDQVARLGRPTAFATQGICLNPSDTTKLLFCERNGSGDAIATTVLT